MLNNISISNIHELFLASNGQACTDTRSIIKGAMFFALKGANYNANGFAQKALDEGCAYAVVDEREHATGPTTILVENVLKTLQHLANYHRSLFTIPVLAITGSNGKTTNKELIYAVLSKKYRVLATEGNLNNHIGVPLTLLRLNAGHEFAIVEMGANHLLEIDELCKIAMPGYGLITNIGKAHLEGFGSEAGVKQGKSELYRYLEKHAGKVFVNGDDEVLCQLATGNNQTTYGCKELSDVVGKDYSVSESISMKYTTQHGEKNWEKLNVVNTKITGRYNFMNCLAAATVGNYFGVEEKDIAAALEAYTPEMNRSQLVKTASNIIILDAYNANPSSMKAAIDNFATYRAEKKMLLLGDMFELGHYSRAEHQKLLELLRENNFENVILVGDEFFKLETGDYKKFRTTAECKNYLQGLGVKNNTILIKGSRGMKMEVLREAL